MESHGTKMNPQIVIMGASKKAATYPLPVNTHIVAANEQPVEVGDIIAKIPRENGVCE